LCLSVRNGIARQSDTVINNAVSMFSQGHPLIMFTMFHISKNYNHKAWTSAGPSAITHGLKIWEEHHNSLVSTLNDTICPGWMHPDHVFIFDRELFFPCIDKAKFDDFHFCSNAESLQRFSSGPFPCKCAVSELTFKFSSTLYTQPMTPASYLSFVNNSFGVHFWNHRTSRPQCMIGSVVHHVLNATGLGGICTFLHVDKNNPPEHATVVIPACILFFFFSLMYILRRYRFVHFGITT